MLISSLIFEPLPTAPKFRDLTNQVFDRLTVLGYAGKRGQHLYWHCQCECGNITTVSAQKLRECRTRSCGCLQREMIKMLNLTHGESHPPTTEFTSYMQARQRCLNPNTKAYKHYGGRGIEFRFDSYENFLKYMGRKPSPEHSLDRYPDKNGNYEQGNIRWATEKQQQQNRRNNRLIEMDGMTHCLAEWCDIKNTPMKRVWGRLQDGWCFPCSLDLPLRGSCLHR